MSSDTRSVKLTSNTVRQSLGILDPVTVEMSRLSRRMCVE